MMETAIWTVLAVGVMVGMFAACVIAVALGVRWLEGVLARRGRKQAG
jgi:hypothetical protein